VSRPPMRSGSPAWTRQRSVSDDTRHLR
jgi:hypothetical protein